MHGRLAERKKEEGERKCKIRLLCRARNGDWAVYKSAEQGKQLEQNAVGAKVKTECSAMQQDKLQTPPPLETTNA